MNKSEFVSAVSNESGVSKADVERVVNGMFDVISGVVARGDEKISLPGFISFEQTTRSARMGRNPQTGEALHVPETKAVKISAGSKLKAAAKSGG